MITVIYACKKSNADMPTLTPSQQLGLPAPQLITDADATTLPWDPNSTLRHFTVTPEQLSAMVKVCEQHPTCQKFRITYTVGGVLIEGYNGQEDIKWPKYFVSTTGDDGSGPFPPFCD